MRKTLRIFISSPGDVQEERLRAHLVVQKLARDYQRFFKIEPYLWEYEPMLASGHFQDAIEPPSRSDIVVLVVYSRLGTALPERTASREYRGIDGRAPVTGTEWEFEEALEAHKTIGSPDLLAYRKLGDPQASLADAGKRAEQERQWDALEVFWRRHFEGGGVFLAGSAKFRSLEEFDAKLEADLVRVIEQKVADGLKDLSGSGDEATWLHGSPFQGLAAYDVRDAPIFFGRDAQIREASTRLQAAAGTGTAFLLVLGASGSGKSSLARAGILPALFAAKAVPGVGLWRRVVLRPAEGGDDPVLGLARALIAGDPADGEGLPELLASGMGAEALAAHLQAAPDDPSYPFRQALAKIADAARATAGLLPHEEARLVILVDQVEELFTRDLDPARRALFVKILAGLAKSGVAWVVATMRNDLWHRAAEIPLLVQLVEAGTRLDLPAPGGAEIIEIVRRPAAAAGIVFEEDHESGIGLDAVISQAASSEPGALPLLSVMLQSLHARDIVDAGGRALTFASYRELGQLRGAIARRADQALAGLAARDPEAAAALPRVLRALVTASADGTATSRPARLDAFATNGPEARLVDAFLAPETRLLVASERNGIAEARLAHEALLENWPTAQEQVATDRRDLETRSRLETLQRRWSEAASPAERKTALLTSLNLAEGADLVRRWGIPAGSGLGTYVAQSTAAERWRRQRFAIAASILILVFAGIAGLASLQWRRADQQAVLARAAEDTERQARASADTARREAERERDRADAEKGRALAALRDAKRNAARTLAAQAELAADRSEVHNALALAATAGDTERDILEPGERSSSEPALLRVLGDNREVLHIARQDPDWHMLPHDFLGDEAVVYADSKVGIMMADLSTGTIRRLAPLPDRVLPTQVRGAPSAGLVVVTGIKTFVAVEASTGITRAAFAFPERLAALDIDEESRTAVVATGIGISFVNLDAPAQAEVFPVPTPRPKVLVGQVRFVPGTRKVLVGYGVSILEFDRDTNTFGETLKAELASDRSGFGRDLAESVAAQALVAIVEMRPDPARDRLMIHTTLDLAAVRPDGTRFSYERDVFDSVLGVDFIGEGPLAKREIASIMGHRREAGLDIRLTYIGDEKSPLTYETFRLSASDLGNEQLKGCKLSRGNRYLACHYSGKTNQGLFVWHVLGGKHRMSRVLYHAAAGSSGGALPGATPRMLAAARTGLVLLPDGLPVTGVEWGSGWRIVGQDGPYVAASSAESRRTQVLRADGRGPVRVALPPAAGVIVWLDGATERALVMGEDRLTIYDLASGRPVWAVPGLAGLRTAALSADGSRVYALAGDLAYAFDGRTGRISATYPVSSRSDLPAAFDPDRRVLAVVGPDGPQLVDLATGQLRQLRQGKGTVSHFALALSAGQVVMGLDDGSVVAVGPTGEPHWTIRPPSDGSFAVNALPGQKAQGTILQLAASRGGRLAIIRQDTASLDLHDLATGQLLTRLTSSSWNNGVPAAVTFDDADRVVTSWAVHALTIGSPHAVSMHALPFGRAESLAAVQVTLDRIVPRMMDGSRLAPPAPPNSH